MYMMHSTKDGISLVTMYNYKYVICIVRNYIQGCMIILIEQKWLILLGPVCSLVGRILIFKFYVICDKVAISIDNFFLLRYFKNSHTTIKLNDFKIMQRMKFEVFSKFICNLLRSFYHWINILLMNWKTAIMRCSRNIYCNMKFRWMGIVTLSRRE